MDTDSKLPESPVPAGLPQRSNLDEKKGVLIEGEAADHEVSTNDTGLPSTTIEQNKTELILAKQEAGAIPAAYSQSGNGVADGLDQDEVQRATNNTDSSLQDKPTTIDNKNNSACKENLPNKLAVASRAPWSMDATKAARLSKAQWLQAHEAILLECGFYVCLDGQADEPRDAFHPIKPKDDLDLLTPVFNQVHELYEYLNKRSLGLAVRKVCQRESPNLYAAAYPLDAVGFPTQPSLPDVDDIENPEVIIELQVPFVALALVLQHYVSVKHDELDFECIPVFLSSKPSKKKTITPHKQRTKTAKETVIEKQTKEHPIPETLGDTQAAEKPLGELDWSTTWDLESARKAITVQDLIKQNKAGQRYRKIAKECLVNTRSQVPPAFNESRSEMHKRRIEEAAELKQKTHELVALWLPDIKEFTDEEKRRSKSEKAAQRLLLLVEQNKELASRQFKEKDVLRRLALCKKTLKRSIRDQESRAKAISELQDAILTGNGDNADLIPRLKTLAEMQEKQNQRTQTASRNVRSIEAELSKLGELSTGIPQTLGEDDGVKPDMHPHASKTEFHACNSLVNHEALKGESFTQLNKRKADDTQKTSAVAHDKLSPKKKARYEVNPPELADNQYRSSQPNIFREEHDLQQGAPVANSIPISSNDQCLRLAEYHNYPQVGRTNNANSFEQAGPYYSNLPQLQEVQLAVPQSQLYQPQSASWGFKSFTIPTRNPPVNILDSFHIPALPDSRSQPPALLQNHV